MLLRVLLKPERLDWGFCWSCLWLATEASLTRMASFSAVSESKELRLEYEDMKAVSLCLFEEGGGLLWDERYRR